jgi:DNA invertase Pin-like site-specific DNA recombinase
VFNIFSALVQIERQLIQERTKAGLAAARARGRRPMSRKHPKVVLANKLFTDRSISIQDICSTLKVSRTTLYRYVSWLGNSETRS